MVAGCASAQPATMTPPAVSAAPVIAAERAFAARAGVIGWIPAFREFTAPDGVMLQPGPVNEPKARARAGDDGGRSLQWWPGWAGVSRGGDFGFTTGPFVFGESDQVRGHYFTVWRRQPDGAWKWIFDAGVGVADADPIARDADVPTLPIATGGAASAAEAVAEVRELERRIALSRPPPNETFARYLADDARVNRRGRPSGAGAGARALAAATPLNQAETLTAEAASAGDLVFTLGRARWHDGAAEREGHYARIWQWRSEGWRIVFDELVPTPPAQAN